MGRSNMYTGAVCVVLVVQCEGMMTALESAHRVTVSMGDSGTPTGKLGSAIGQDNDRFLNSESDRQQLLLRCRLLPASCTSLA